jgi:1,4-dihydroxy-2-naphthoate polyprenyltransferase
VLLLAIALVMLARVGIATSWWAALGLLGFVPLLRATVLVVRRTVGRDLIPVLQLTGLGELLYAAGLFAGLLLAR